MQWQDDAIVLSAQRHGESALIVHLLTLAHGRHAGLAPGAGGRRQALFQPGNRLRCRWRARLADHLGTLTAEPAHLPTALLFGDGGRLAALAAACALCRSLLPERAPYPRLFRGLEALLEALEAGDAPPLWQAAYVMWEVGLLSEIGFALDLETCTATGSREDLCWVSPRTGRAVSGAAGAPWAKRLLPLPGFLTGAGAADADAVQAGLRLTGHFLGRAGDLPPARARLPEVLARRSAGFTPSRPE